jgi:hypothetical protein
MITISFAPLPVAPNAAAGSATEADAAGFGSAMDAVGRRPSGISFTPLIATGTGTPAAPSAIPQGMLVAAQQPAAQPALAPAPSAAGALVAPGLRDRFAAALAKDQADRPVRDIIGGAIQFAVDQRAANEAAIAPAPTPASAPGSTPAKPGVVEFVGAPSPVTGPPPPQGDAAIPVQDIAQTLQADLDAARAALSIEKVMKDELAKSQADRPIDVTVNSDLAKSKEDRPIEQNMLDSLIAGKDELKLSEEAEQRLIATIVEEDGSVDPEAQKQLIENANVMLQEKYQAIIDSFAKRVGKSPAPGPVEKTS